MGYYLQRAGGSCKPVIMIKTEDHPGAVELKGLVGSNGGTRYCAGYNRALVRRIY